MEDRGRREGNDTPALVAAVRDGSLSLVMQLVKLGHSLHERDKDGATALYWACSRGHASISDFLINAGSDVNARVKWGTTPLIAAADNGQEICTSQLLRQHADVNAANNRGDTALHAAAYRGYEGVLCLLMEAGANPFLKNSASMTPLQEAYVQQKQECVQRLQEYMNVRGFSGPVSLPIPSQEYTSYTGSLGEQYSSWPYTHQISSSNRSRSSQEQHTQSPSLHSPRMGIKDQTKIHSLNYYDRATPLFEIKQSLNPDLLRPKTQSLKMFNTESVDDMSSCHRPYNKHLLHLSDSSIVEPSSGGKRGNLSFDSLLINAVSIPSKSGCQVLYNNGHNRPSSLPSLVNQEVTSESPRVENVNNSKKSETNKEILTAPILVPRDKSSKYHNLTEYEHNTTHGAASNTRPLTLSDLNESFAPEKRSGKTKYVSGKVMPGVNVSEFVERLQFQVIELQEIVIQSNSVIAHLKDQLADVQRENKELKTENLHFRNLLHYRDFSSDLINNQRDLSSDLITRGPSESGEGGQCLNATQEKQQSVARLVKRSEFESRVDSRQAIESGECENSPL